YLQPAKGSNDDEQLFENRIWIPDIDLGYRLAAVLDDGLNDVLVGFRDDQGFFEKLLKKTIAETAARHLKPNMEDAEVVYMTHTYCGLFCVVLNPWRTLPIYTTDVMATYRTGVGDGYPHVYMVAQSAYDGILRGGRNQSILITGESGAGKTENTKKIIEYILECCGCTTKEQPQELSNGLVNGYATHGSAVGGDVISAGVLLEAFGNARTTHNNNSSRFGSWVGAPTGPSLIDSIILLDSDLLEKSRVVNQDNGNRNFHVFYQLLSNAFPNEMREKLLLTQTADHYKFLNQGNACVDKEIDDVANGLLTDVRVYRKHAMDRLGITGDEKFEVYSALAACLLIGEIKFGERSGLDMSYVEGKQEVDAVTSLLGLKSSRLVEALTQPSIRVGDKVIRKNQNMQKSVFSAAALAKTLYERVFKWLLSKCNEAISANTSMLTESIMSSFIGVLDIAGFEIVQKNSFEQLCINYTNEKLQAFFNHFMFVREQSEYLQEGIQWIQSDFALDLQPTIDVIEKPLGLLSLLEEECVVPNGSDQSLLQKLCTTLEKYPQFKKAKHSQRCQSVRHFTIKHYAGSVDYNIDSWVEKNRDVVENAILENQLSSLLDTLSSSSAHFIRCVVPNYERVPNKVDGPLVLNQLRAAICTIQNNVRTFAELADWPWYRIFNLVRPLIPK
ncbi:myosin head, partial [Teladorsagia circumcincta]